MVPIQMQLLKNTNVIFSKKCITCLQPLLVVITVFYVVLCHNIFFYLVLNEDMKFIFCLFQALKSLFAVKVS